MISVRAAAPVASVAVVAFAGVTAPDEADAKAKIGKKAYKRFSRAETEAHASSANDFGTVATISLVAGGVAALAGGTVLLLDSDGDASGAAVGWTW